MRPDGKKAPLTLRVKLATRGRLGGPHKRPAQGPTPPRAGALTRSRAPDPPLQPRPSALLAGSPPSSTRTLQWRSRFLLPPVRKPGHHSPATCRANPARTAPAIPPRHAKRGAGPSRPTNEHRRSGRRPSVPTYRDTTGSTSGPGWQP